MRTAFPITLCCLLAACQSFHAAPAESVRDLRALASVQSIYVAELGQEEGADLLEASDSVREEISVGLARSGRFTVVQDPQQADAILAGLAGVERWYHGMEGYYGMEGDLDSHELGVGKLRLVDSKTKQTIWTHAYTSGFLHPKQSVASRVAAQVVDKLIEDAARADPMPVPNE